MCGIAGSLSPLPADSLRSTLHAMATSLSHRGPDAEGLAVERVGEWHLALAHRRLSILDLSPLGAQPMASNSGRYLLVFNGEIYNHLDLRDSLAKEGAQFRGRSDTETMLAAFDRWGFLGALEKFAGMFAFALWDKEERLLYLARDRLGEKPIHYGWSGGSFLFSSELKALQNHPHFNPEIDAQALELMLTFGYIPSPHTIYRNFRKLPPAHYVAVSPELRSSEPKPYWSLSEVAHRGVSHPLSLEEAPSAVTAVVSKVVREQLVSDVPIGAFLSGGIDSSLVSAIAAKAHSQRLRTFSIGFDQKDYDESPYAEEVARSIGSEHVTLRVRGEDALALVPSLPSYFDEPFGDASALPTILLCQLTRKNVTVALSGDGGDEAFGGYNRYLHGPRLLQMRSRIPASLRAPVANLAEVTGNSAFASLFPFPQPSEKARKVAQALRSDSLNELYWEMMAQGLRPGKPYRESNQDRAWNLPSFGPMQLFDQSLYLPDDILVKVDRASMAASLEVRAPLLDHRVIEIAWRLPFSLRAERGRGKILPRRLLRELLPQIDFERPKTGFTPPIGDWLRGPLREWAEDLLHPKALQESGIPDPEDVRRAWSHHLKTPRSAGLRLWPTLMAQAWLRRPR